MVLVESKVEGSTMLDDGAVEGRQQYMVVIVKFGHGDDKQAVILSRITVNNGRTGIGSRTVCSQQLFLERLL
jgi:hypothetical protein